MIATQSKITETVEFRHSNKNDPTADEKAALVGTNSFPGSGNKFVTNSDPRNSNARVPTSHNHVESDLSLSDSTNNNASISNHGFVPRAVAPAANKFNVIGIANGETILSNKTILNMTTPSTQVFGDSAIAGTLLEASHVDHKHTMPANPVSYATPSIALSSSTAAGSALTLIRSDATIQAFDSTIPAAISPDGTAATGSINYAARRDHQHGVATYSSTPQNTTPAALSTAGTLGTAPSRGDHAHQSPGAIIVNTSQVSITNTTSETTILTVTLPTNFFAVGTQFLFRFQGTHQSQATSGILTIRMYVGANAGQTVQLSSQSSAISASFVCFEGIATVRTIGSSGIYIATGFYDIVNAATTRLCAVQGGTTTTTVNTTATAPAVKITAQWTTASSTNSLLIQNATIEVVKM